MSASQPEDSTALCPGAHELTVVALGTRFSTDAILRQHFSIDEDSNIRFSNRYYTATVPVRVYPQLQVQLRFSDGSFCNTLCNCPAVVVVSSDDSEGSISKCKETWGQLNKHCSEAAVKILFIDGNTLSEADTYRLVNWALGHGVEVVTRLLCEEDGISLALRIERALECAKWPQLVAKQSGKPAHQEAKLEPFDEEKTGSEDPENEVLHPTRLRRGLNDADVSILMNDMLLADETDSDA